MSEPLLVEDLGLIETALEAAPLGLTLINRPGVRRASDERMHKGVAVLVPSSENADLDRDAARAFAVDVYQIEFAYRMKARTQRTTRDEALILEAQIRQLVTSRDAKWPMHLIWRGSTREYQGESQEWLVITQTFNARRYAGLGG